MPDLNGNRTIVEILNHNFGFNDKDAARKFFMELRQIFVDWNCGADTCILLYCGNSCIVVFAIASRAQVLATNNVLKLSVLGMYPPNC